MKKIALLSVCLLAGWAAASHVGVGIGEDGLMVDAGAVNLTKDNLVAEVGNLWGVSNSADKNGMYYFSYSTLAGTTLPATIQPGTYFFVARIGNGDVFPFAGLNDITEGTNLEQGSVAGFFLTLDTGNAQVNKNNMFTEFNAQTGVTYTQPSGSAPPALGWVDWNFKWIVEAGSPVIGTEPYFGVYTRTGVSGGAAFWDDSDLYFVAPGEYPVPIAQKQSIVTWTDVPADITLTGNSLEEKDLTYAVVDWPVHGTLVTNEALPNLTYTPTIGYQGADSFTFTVNDGETNSLPATVSIIVTNAPPVADAQNVRAVYETPLAITLTGSDADDGPSNLTYSVTSQPVNGTLTTNGALPNLTYTPASGYLGADSFTFTVNDGLTNSAPATVSITVLKFATEIIAGYDFDDGTGTATRAVTVKDAHVTASNYGVGAGLKDNVNGPNGNSNFSDLDAEGDVFGTANGFEYGGAQSDFGFANMGNQDNLDRAITEGDYMTFTVEPAGGYELNLTKFTFRTRVNEINNSAERWALFSSVGGFASGNEIIVGRTGAINTYVNTVIDLSAAEFQGLSKAIEFRLYIYGGN